MKKLMTIVLAAVLSAATIWAMPTNEEIKRVQPLVNELMSAHLKGFNAKKETAKEVADAAAGLTKEAEGEAAKYLLLKGAIYYYALAKEYDKVADALETLRASVKDFPEEEVASLASKALDRAGRGEAQRLRALYRVASMRATAEADVKSFKTALRKDCKDKAALRGLADAYVRLSDWPRALKVFSKLGIRAAEFELNPEDAKDFNVLNAADYWWEFKAKDADPYRIHAAALYRKALAADLAKGLMKPIVEKRIAEVDAFEVPAAMQVQDMTRPRFGTAAKNGRRYCIIDLSPGPNAQRYSVTWRDYDPPSSGWTDEYKTTKLVLRRIEPGTFIMGENQKDESHRVTFTKPFYIGVFELTQKQYALVTGVNPSTHKGDKRPVTDISISHMRGSFIKYNWPMSREVAPNSFMGRIRARTGLEGFELPTEAQWEYACRAGTKTLRYDGSDIFDRDSLLTLGRLVFNQRARGWKEPDSEFKRHKPDGKGGYMGAHTSVGMYKPNAWGLYDMYGNVSEWCVSRRYDSYGENPLGRLGGPRDGRPRRGGSWASLYEPSIGNGNWREPWEHFTDAGFRLVLNVDE